MKRLLTISKWFLGIVVATMLVVSVAGIYIVRSDWLREKVRTRVIEEAQKATGGKVEIGGFRFDWHTLTAEFDKLVIHGREAADQAPLATIEKVSIGLRIISLMKRDFDVVFVKAERPRVHLIVGPDGKTNLPEPPHPSGSATETILDLKIGNFELEKAEFTAESPSSALRHTGWSARGENLAARVRYAPAGTRYEGDISLAPLHLALDGAAPFDASVEATAAMQKDRITFSRAVLTTAASQVELTDGLINGFVHPVATAKFAARVSLREADRIFKLVNFQHSGTVEVTGNGRFASVDDYAVTGDLRGTGIQYGQVKQLGITGKFGAKPDTINFAGLRISALGGSITATAEVRKLDTFEARGTLDHFNAADIAGVLGVRAGSGEGGALPYNGLLSGEFNAAGMLSEPQLHRIVGDATLTVSPTPGGKPVSGQIRAHYDGNVNAVELGPSWIELPSSRVDVSGTLGKALNVRLRSKDLADLAPAAGDKPFPFELRNGSVAFDGSVTGPMEHLQIAGHGELANAVISGRKIESLTGDLDVSESGLKGSNIRLAWGDVRARGSGTLGLAGWAPQGDSMVSANLQISAPDLPGMLALAGITDVPVTGSLNTTVLVSGTMNNPEAGSQFTLSRGQMEGEPFDVIAGRLRVNGNKSATVDANVTAGAKRLTVSGHFDHAGAGAADGRLTFQARSNSLPLAQIGLVRKWQPTIGGTAEFRASGVLVIDHSAAGRIRFSLPDLNADVAATGLALGDRTLGDTRLTATTKSNVLSVKLDSSAAQTAVHGEGTMGLTGQYPLEGTMRFVSPDIRAVAALVMPGQAKNLNFDGAAEGEVKFRGEARTPEQITGTAELSKIELRPGSGNTQPSAIKGMVVRNDGVVRLSLAKSLLKVEQARFIGPQTTLGVSGTIGVGKQSVLDLDLAGNVNVALAETFTRDLTASGNLAIDAVVRGSFANPDFSGRADLRNAEFHYADFTNGLTNANAAVRFSGTRANIQSFSGETGGGKVDATGFITIVDGIPAFRLETKVREVRVRYPEGVSSVSDGDITIAGTGERSEASGRVTIRRISINPKSDLSTILAASAQPARTPEARSGLFSNLNFDIQVDTAPDVEFQTNVAQRIQADANLRLRGTATNPAVLGRINITQGELVFFGNKYTINQGAISFFNPGKIDPILNLDLETKARGVDVILTATGPIAKLNVSYRSDPPLQFADIVALLATGRTPTDPTLAVRDTGQSQNLQQLGASALLGQAIANPVAGRLQRFFGVSRIKIDPQLTGVTASPQARLTIEQQITPDLLFTYVSDVANTSTQLIRMEWAFNRRWSAVLTRAENGYVNLDFAFKKSFR